jgi:hypothetical protein
VGKGLSRQQSRKTKAVRTPESSICPTTVSTATALAFTEAESSILGRTGMR